MLHQAERCGPGRYQRTARLFLGQSAETAVERCSVLVEEHLELGAGWLIDDTLGERRGQGMHVRRPTATSPRHPEQLANIGVSRRILSTVPIAER